MYVSNGLICATRGFCFLPICIFIRKRNHASLPHLQEIKAISIMEHSFIFILSCKENALHQTTEQQLRKNQNNFPFYCGIVSMYKSNLKGQQMERQIYNYALKQGSYDHSNTRIKSFKVAYFAKFSSQLVQCASVTQL